MRNERSTESCPVKTGTNYLKSKRHTHVCAAFLMLCLMSFILPGCTKSGSASQQSDANAGTGDSGASLGLSYSAGAIGEQTKSDASSESQEHAVTNPVTITLGHDLDALHAEILQGLTDVFNETNQEGITVKLIGSTGNVPGIEGLTDDDAVSDDEDVAGDADTTAYTQANTQANTQADTALTSARDVDILLADVGEIQKLSRSALSVNDFLTSHPENFRQYRIELLDASSVTGIVYGLPFSLQADVVFYNAGLLSEAGALVPTDINSFFTSAEQVMEKRHVPLLGAEASFLEALLRGYDVALTNTTSSNQTPSSGGVLNDLFSSQGEAAVSVLLKLFRGGFIRIYEDPERMRQEYLNGAIGGYLGTTDDLTYTKAERFQTTPALLPFGTTKASAVSMQDFFLLTKDNKKLQAAQSFLTYMTSENTLSLWAVGTGDLSVTKASFEFKEYLTFMETDAVSRVMADEGIVFYFSDKSQSATDLRRALSLQLENHAHDEVTAKELLDAVKEGLQ